jgi:hypothetical protein
LAISAPEKRTTIAQARIEPIATVNCCVPISMAGYSGTPLPKKLGIKEHSRVTLLDVPEQIKSELKEPLASCQIVTPNRAPLDFVLVFVKSQAELKRQCSRLWPQLAPAGILWVCWPKKISGLPSDLNENEIRRIGLEIGLVDVKVCAVSEIWSGLKFVIPVKDRAART